MVNKGAIVLAYASLLAGTGSVLLFTVFLFTGSFGLLKFDLSRNQAILFDVFLSLLFFLQHSVMTRRGIRGIMGRLAGEAYYDAVYSIVSAVVLASVVILWQAVPPVLASAGGIGYWSLRVLFFAGIAGFIWGSTSIKTIDPYGVKKIKRHIYGKKANPAPLTARGAYKWVRHPLYLFMMVLIWSSPTITLDRLIFNVAWTVWMVIATFFEEGDLIGEFGDRYREYKRRVPMFIPYKVPD